MHKNTTYFKRVFEEVRRILKSTLAYERHIKRIPLWKHRYILYVVTKLHQVICSKYVSSLSCLEGKPRADLFTKHHLWKQQISAIYPCIGLNTARLQSVLSVLGKKYFTKNWQTFVYSTYQNTLNMRAAHRPLNNNKHQTLTFNVWL